MDLTLVAKLLYQNKLDKGYNTSDIEQEMCNIAGEVLEAAIAYRTGDGTVGEELADIILYTLGLAELLGVDAEAEVARKLGIVLDRPKQ